MKRSCVSSKQKLFHSIASYRMVSLCSSMSSLSSPSSQLTRARHEERRRFFLVQWVEQNIRWALHDHNHLHNCPVRWERGTRHAIHSMSGEGEREIYWSCTSSTSSLHSQVISKWVIYLSSEIAIFIICNCSCVCVFGVCKHYSWYSSIITCYIWHIQVLPSPVMWEIHIKMSP